VQGTGYRDSVLTFRVLGVGFLRFRVGFTVWGLGLRF